MTSVDNKSANTNVSKSENIKCNTSNVPGNESEEINVPDRWTGLSDQNDFKYSAESAINANQQISTPEFDSGTIPDKVIKFAAICIARVVQLRVSDAQLSTASQIEYFLGRMRKEAGLRTTELLQALALIDTITRQNLEQQPFELTKENVFLVLLVCVMIAHKSNCDRPFSNGWWSRKFGATLPTINESEVFILKLLNFNTLVPLSTYQAYHKTIFLVKPFMLQQVENVNKCECENKTKQESNPDPEQLQLNQEWLMNQEQLYFYY